MTSGRIASQGRKPTLQLIMGAVALPLVLAGCQGEKDLDLSTYVETIEPADALYNQGLANLNAGRLKEAAAKFEAVDRQHPYSEFGRKALLMSTFTNYRQGRYSEAANNGQRYLTLYPTSDDAAYAQYLVGLSYFRQIKEVTQDQSEARKTIEAMNQVVERWPDSEYVEDAQAKIRFAVTSSPARKCRSAAIISSAANISPPSAVSAAWSKTTPIPATLKRHWRVLRKPILPWVLRRKPKRQRLCSGTISPKASGTSRLISFCSPAVWNRVRTGRPGSRRLQASS